MPQELVERILQAHEQAMVRLRTEQAVQLAIARQGGRSSKAIQALLDMDTIAQSANPADAAEEAVKKLKQAQDYLFIQPAPVYAPGTGTEGYASPEPQSLSGALKERFGK